MLEVLKECRELALPKSGEMLPFAGVSGSQLGALRLWAELLASCPR